MKTKEKVEFIYNYIQYIEQANEAMKSNNYQKNNKIVKESMIFCQKNCNAVFFKEAINELMDSENIFVSIAASVDAIKYDCNKNKAVKILYKAKNGKNSKASLEAQMALITFKDLL